MKRPVSGQSNTKSNDSSTDSPPKIPASIWSKANIALCFDSGGLADLETGKVYRVICDSDALRSGMLRIIDNSGDDYLYPSDWFVPLNLTKLSKSILIARNSDLFPDPKRVLKNTSRMPKSGKSHGQELNAGKIGQSKRKQIVKHRTS